MSDPVVSFRTDPQLVNMLENAADERGINRGDIAEQIIIDNITDYEFLSELERKYAQAKQAEREESMERFITQRKMKAATFINYARSQARQLLRNGASRDEVIEILGSMRGIADRRDKLAEFEDYIEEFKDGKDNEAAFSNTERPYER